PVYKPIPMSPPRLLGLATAVPSFPVDQDMVRESAGRLFDLEEADLKRLLPIYDNAGIERRYSCVPPDWYLRPHGWVERSKLFAENAVDLLVQATRKCLALAEAA